MTSNRHAPGGAPRPDRRQGVVRVVDELGQVRYVQLRDVAGADLTPEEREHILTLGDGFLGQLEGFNLGSAGEDEAEAPANAAPHNCVQILQPSGATTFPIHIGRSNPYPDGEPRVMVRPARDLPSLLGFDTREQMGIRNSGGELLIERSG